MFDSFKPSFSRFFNGTSAVLEKSTAVVTAVPITLFCWFRSDEAAISSTLMTASDNNTTNRFALVSAGATGGDPINALTGNAAAASSTGFTVGKWHTACGVFSAVDARAAYIDGGSKGTNTTSRTPGGINRLTIGARYSLTLGAWYTGRIAWPCVWNVALTDAEVFALSQGVHPRSIHPENIVAFWDFTGATIEPSIGMVPNAHPVVNTDSVPSIAPGFLRSQIQRPYLFVSSQGASAGNPWHYYQQQMAG